MSKKFNKFIKNEKKLSKKSEKIFLLNNKIDNVLILPSNKKLPTKVDNSFDFKLKRKRDISDPFKNLSLWEKKFRH
jgi:hypothetical protein